MIAPDIGISREIIRSRFPDFPGASRVLLGIFELFELRKLLELFELFV